MALTYVEAKGGRVALSLLGSLGDRSQEIVLTLDLSPPFAEALAADLLAQADLARAQADGEVSR